MAAKKCSVEGCSSIADARGWCSMHYQRWAVHGDPLKVLRKRVDRVPKEHFGAWRAWSAMRYRCENQKSQNYSYYGGRGIKVCDKWQSFWSFLEDMGDRPAGMSIDRIDPSKGYEPGNCRWATKKQQSRNQSNVLKFTINGETLPVPDWADRLGINRKLVKERIRKGWDIQSALTEPVGNIKEITYRGEVRRLSEWAKVLGIPDAVLRSRIDKRGWAIEKAFSHPVRSRRKP